MTAGVLHANRCHQQASRASGTSASAEHSDRPCAELLASEPEPVRLRESAQVAEALAPASGWESRRFKLPTGDWSPFDIAGSDGHF